MAVHLGLNDLEIDAARWQLDSPRSLQACQKAGIDQNELVELPLSNFCDADVPEQISQLRWTQAKDRVARNRKLVRRYHSLEVNAAPPAHLAARSWADPEQGPAHDPSKIPAVAAVSRRVHKLQHRSAALAKERVATMLDTATHFTGLQEEAERKHYNHFATKVQGPRVLHKKNAVKYSTMGGLHGPSGHVQRKVQDDELTRADRLLAKSKDHALLALEQCDNEIKDERVRQRKDLVEDFGRTRDIKLKKMHDSHVRHLEDKATRKKVLLERTEGMCELAAAHLKKKKEQEILRVQIELEKQTMRADHGAMTQLSKQESRRLKLVRKHRLDDLKHEHLRLVRDERQKQNQMRMRARELRAQERYHEEHSGRKQFAETLLEKMTDDDKRLKHLQQQQAAQTALHSERNRLQHQERMQRKADIVRWERVEQEQLREAAKVKEEYSDRILRSKDELTHVISRAKCRLLKERDHQFDQLLMSQTTGSWAELERKSRIRNGMAETAPARAFSCPPLDTPVPELVPEQEEEQAWQEEQPAEEEQPAGEEEENEYNVQFSATATATKMDYDFGGDMTAVDFGDEIGPFDGTMELPEKEKTSQDGARILQDGARIMNLAAKQEAKETAGEAGEQVAVPVEVAKEEPLEPEHRHVTSTNH